MQRHETKLNTESEGLQHWLPSSEDDKCSENALMTDITKYSNHTCISYPRMLWCPPYWNGQMRSRANQARLRFNNICLSTRMHIAVLIYRVLATWLHWNKSGVCYLLLTPKRFVFFLFLFSLFFIFPGNLSMTGFSTIRIYLFMDVNRF